jgi:hypothetical protein
MKIKKLVLILILCFVATMGFSQEKTKKQLKEERKIEKQKQIALLIDAKEFVFVARTAFPLGYRSVDLTTNFNYVNFLPEFIKSELPFFGRATGNVSYGGDGGLNFEAIPSDYVFEKGNKSYTIKGVVKDKNDSYRLVLTVFFEGSASLSITSNNRSSISYNGEIFKLIK